MKAARTTCIAVFGVLFFSVCIATKSTAVPIGGPIYNPATGHNYYLLENSNWTDAQSQALSLGGNLVTINDAAENAWVSQTFSNFGNVQRNLWIGLTSAPASGGNPSNYYWVDGSTSTYRNWAPGEPNGTDQYTYIIPGGNANAGQWNNIPDVTSAGYLTFPAIPNYGVAEVVPEPSTYLLVLMGGLLFWRQTKNSSK